MSPVKLSWSMIVPMFLARSRARLSSDLSLASVTCTIPRPKSVDLTRALLYIIRTGKVSTVLHELNVEVVPQSECNEAYFGDAQTNLFFQADYPEGITNRLLCAGKINDVCRGDSGGPLVLNEGGIMQEVGVVSTGYGCGEARFPSIYTRVDQYTQWITNELFSGCT
ncbi:clotting factor G beta subunit-like [Penaeus indicus]|uniref:clotting factor G beta subunit-like n=1 Tax=Penaeus indicus TaxID=29960 RepID=UPI00300CADE6